METKYKTPYALAHLDASHNRPTSTKHRAQDTFAYTMKDLKYRIAHRFEESGPKWKSKLKELGQLHKTGAKYGKDTVLFYKQNPGIFRKEFLSGITVALLQVPESVAFSYVAGLDSLYGLYATVFMGSITALLGGKPAMISGAAGALAVVLAEMTDNNGPLSSLLIEERIQHVLMAVILSGVIQTGFGLLGLAKFVTLIPATAMIGFLNGLAIIIFQAQLSTFKVCTVEGLAFEECSALDKLEWMSLSNGQSWMVLLSVVMTMFTMQFFPKVPKIGPIIPASLVAIIVATTFEFAINRPLLGWNVRTVEDTAPISGGFPSPRIPDLGDNADWNTVIKFSISLAAIGLFESIMTLQAVNEITKTVPTVFACNMEAIAQGVGNFVSGVFNSMGGDAMIGQSTINVINGARFRLSAFTAGIIMLLIIQVGSPAIEKIPTPSLAGVLFIIVIHTFYWPTFKLLLRLHLVDVISIIGVTALAVTTNLAIAVIAGIVWEALVSVWRNGKLLKCEIVFESEPPSEHAPRTTAPTDGPSMSSDEITDTTQSVKVYHLEGPLTFGSARQFRSFFTIDADPSHVAIDFKDSLICDFSAVVAIRELATRYKEANKRVSIRHLSHLSRGQIRRDRDWVIIDQHHAKQPSLTNLDVFHPEEVPLNAHGMQPGEILQDIIESGEIELEQSPKNHKN